MQADACAQVGRKAEPAPVTSIDEVTETEGIVAGCVRLVENHVHAVAGRFDMFRPEIRRFVEPGYGAGVVLEKQRYLVFAEPRIPDCVGKQHGLYFVPEIGFLAPVVRRMTDERRRLETDVVVVMLFQARAHMFEGQTITVPHIHDRTGAADVAASRAVPYGQPVEFRVEHL